MTPRKPLLHELKIWPEYLDAIKQDRKTFELRENDRDFRVGDFIYLRGWNRGEDCYTGDMAIVRINYVLYHQSTHGLKEGWVILSIARVEEVRTKLT